MKRFIGNMILIFLFCIVFLLAPQDSRAVASCSCPAYADDETISFGCNQPNSTNTMYRVITCISKKTTSHTRGIPDSCKVDPYPIPGNWQTAEGVIDTSVHSNNHSPTCWNTDSIPAGGCVSVPPRCDQTPPFVAVPGDGVPTECLQYANTACGLIPCSCRGNFAYKGCNQCGGNPACLATEGSCGALFHGNLCSGVSCACKNACGCSSQFCPTPTPLPTPFCTLECLGRSGFSQSQGSSGGISQNGMQSGPPPTVMPQLGSGNITYGGYNGFSCGTFSDGTGDTGSCPASSGGSGTGSGLTASWAYPVRYNMLCGETPHTYTAIVDDELGLGGFGQAGHDESAGAGNSEIGSTPGPGTPTPTPQLYPPGCQIGVTSAPTPTQGATAGDSRGAAGGVSGMSDSSFCSCAVTLSCQQALAASPNANGTGCDSSCNFSVSPDYPLFNTQVTFQTTESTPSNGISFSFDDGSNDVANQQTVNHTFVNAGLYNVTLSCNSRSCTRAINSYCNNGIAPSATPTPTTSANPWFKVKDADFVSSGAISNVIPGSVTAFDSDDTGSPDCSGVIGGSNISCMSMNQPGIVTSTGTIDVGSSGTLSSRGWKLENYTIKRQITAANYVDYVVQRKKPKKIVSADSVIDASEIQKGYINIITGDYTITDPLVAAQAPYVLIVKGSLTIDTPGTFGVSGNAVGYVVTGTLNITSQTTELNGIYSATNLDIASDIADDATTTNTLKIRGNMSITNQTTTRSKRVGVSNAKPPVFTELDFRPFTELLSLMSIRRYEWEELSP